MLNVLPTHVVFNKAEPIKISGQSYFLSVHLVEEIDFFFPKPSVLLNLLMPPLLVLAVLMWQLTELHHRLLDAACGGFYIFC